MTISSVNVHVPIVAVTVTISPSSISPAPFPAVLVSTLLAAGPTVFPSQVKV